MKIHEPLSNIIWDTKYRYRLDDQIVDQSIEDTWQRVAKAIAQAEKKSERTRWQEDFFGILQHYQFLPGGRILAGAGTQHRVTLFNCFVMNIAEDSMKSIFNALKEGALTLQQGGGVGYDFSVLRPAGELAKKTGMPASGPVSFMEIWDAMCGVLLSTGARRGAMMGVLRCDHPDIETFINAKSEAHALRHFNVSVMVSDEFMQAVKENAEWPLIFPVQSVNPSDEIIYKQWNKSAAPIACRVYKKVNARELWRSIIRYAYDYAEPGVLFGDTINRLNNLSYCEQIHATNPCGEIPLPAYGACNLGAINLTQFVAAPFTDAAKINWIALENVISIATRFLDNVIDVSKFPLLSQSKQALATRRIGLGVTGLADMLVMLGIRYGSPESIKIVSSVMKQIRDVTWMTSIELAKEKGVFPLYNKKYLHGLFVQTLDQDMQKKLAQYGVRNSHHNTIAPAGTISLLANNVSNGIEPIFSASYERRVRGEGDEVKTFAVKDYAYHLWMHENHSEELPPAWVDVTTLSPDAHLAMQAAVQPFIDNAISKTINVPKDFPYEAMLDVYSKAYAYGLKGCTVFRPNEVRGSVLAAHGFCEGKIKECCG